MTQSFFKDRYGRNFTGGEGLPAISTQLDSVRAYQFEVQFFGLPFDRIAESVDLTLAAKQVSPPSFAVEDIPTDRVNDRVYYPGRPTQEDLTITFDNLYLKETAPTLWEWFQSVYDPMTGEMTKNTRPGGADTPNFKAHKLEIIELDNVSNPFASVGFFGVYPKAFKLSEKNYSTNEFSTIEVIFRFDFMDYNRISDN